MKRKYDGGDSSARKKRKKDKKSKHKHKKKKSNKHEKESKSRRHSSDSTSNTNIGPQISLPESYTSNEQPKKLEDCSSKKVRTPMTEKEWKAEQSKLQRVYDPETGRNRLVRGNGEIVEEIVSKERQKEINKKATESDGLFYMKNANKLTS